MLFFQVLKYSKSPKEHPKLWNSKDKTGKAQGICRKQCIFKLLEDCLPEEDHRAERLGNRLLTRF